MRRPILILTVILTVGTSAAGCHRAAPSRPDAGPARAAATATATATPAPPPPRGKQIAIVYSSNLLGEYEPCG